MSDSGAPAKPRDVGRLLAVGIAAVGLLWLLLGMISFPGGEGWGYDYQAYADAAVRLAETGSLYQAETLDGPYRPGPYGLYMYAPPLGVAVTPLTGLATETGTLVWYGLHLLALVAACALLPVSTTVRLATFGVAALSVGVTRDLVLGNVSILLLLLLAAAWRWLDRPAGSIAQALAMAVRPMLGILLLWQLARRQWRPVAWTVLAGIALILISLPFVGVTGYTEYLTVLRNLSEVSGVEFNYDLGSTALAAGLDETVATALLLAGYGVAIAAVVLSLRRDREVGFIVTASASLLLSPLLWDHYLTMLILPGAFLAARGRPWGLVLPLLAWLPQLVESWAFLFPLLALAGVLLPFLARDPQDAAVDGHPTPVARAPAGTVTA